MKQSLGWTRGRRWRLGSACFPVRRDTGTPLYALYKRTAKETFRSGPRCSTYTAEPLRHPAAGYRGQGRKGTRARNRCLPGAYAHVTTLGGELADGIEEAIGSAGLPWTVIRLGPRSGQWYGPMPRTGAEAHALTDGPLTALIRIWLANRGIWEALPGAGPTVPIPATRADVTRYIEAYHDLLAHLR